MKKNLFSAASVPFSLRGQTLWLLPQKAIFWEEQEILILADLHLGKAAHFRKAGIPIPSAIHHHDLNTLRQLISHFHPAQILILGDLFHSVYNKEWLDFENFLLDLSAYSFSLVKGNHDILPDAAYQISNLTVFEDTHLIPPFFFRITQPLR